MSNNDPTLDNEFKQRKDIIALTTNPQKLAEKILGLLESGEEVLWIPSHMDLIGEAGENFKRALELWRDPVLSDLIGDSFTILDAYLIALYYKNEQKEMIVDYAEDFSVEFSKDIIDPETGEVTQEASIKTTQIIKRKLFIDSMKLRKIRDSFKMKLNLIRKNPDELFKGDYSLREVVILSDNLSDIPFELRQRLTVELIHLTVDDDKTTSRIAEKVRIYSGILNGQENKLKFGNALIEFKYAIFAQASNLRSKALELTNLYHGLTQGFPEKTVLLSVAAEGNDTLQYSIGRIGIEIETEPFETYQLSPYFQLTNKVAIDMNDTHTDLNTPLTEREWERELLRDNFYQDIVYSNVEINRFEAFKIATEVEESLSDEEIDLLIETFNKRKVKMNLIACLVQIKGKRYDLLNGSKIKGNWLPEEG